MIDCSWAEYAKRHEHAPPDAEMVASVNAVIRAAKGPVLAVLVNEDACVRLFGAVETGWAWGLDDGRLVDVILADVNGVAVLT